MGTWGFGVFDDDTAAKVRDTWVHLLKEGVTPRDATATVIERFGVITPRAKDELTGSRGGGYRRMIELCPAGRAGTPDEVGTVGALLMGADGAFITGSDFPMDGGVTVTASYWSGELAPK